MDSLVDVIDQFHPGDVKKINPRSIRRPLKIKPEQTIPIELLFAQLNDNGKVTASDFLAQSRLALQTSSVEDYDQTSSR